MKDAKCVLSELEMLKKFCEDNISEAITVAVCRVFEGCRVAVVDAIKLIEEQEERIAIMTESKPEVVMCKDCKFAFKHWNNMYRCDNYHGTPNGYGEHQGGWFCAEGERGDKKA